MRQIKCGDYAKNKMKRNLLIILTTVLLSACGITYAQESCAPLDKPTTCNGISVAPPCQLSTGAYINYILGAENCGPIKGLTVSLHALEKMHAEDGNGSGFSIQLNAYEDATQNFLQFLFFIGINAIQVQIQDHGANGGSSPQNSTTLVTDATNEILHDETLSIELKYDQNTWNVNGATFKITSGNAGDALLQGCYDESSSDKAAGGSKKCTMFLPVPNSKHLPIRGFQVNVVDYPERQTRAYFSSGAGSITYQVSNGQLCNQGSNTAYTCIPAAAITAEMSNIIYSAMYPPCCGSKLTQYFFWF
jgi:hypothetical protein